MRDLGSGCSKKRDSTLWEKPNPEPIFITKNKERIRIFYRIQYKFVRELKKIRLLANKSFTCKFSVQGRYNGDPRYANVFGSYSMFKLLLLVKMVGH